MKYLVYIILITLGVISLTSYTEAHSWYPFVCCGGQDCHPVPCSDLINTGKDYVYHGIHFLKEQVQPSLDNQCHVCISNENILNATPIPHCAFIQLNS